MNGVVVRNQNDVLSIEDIINIVQNHRTILSEEDKQDLWRMAKVYFLSSKSNNTARAYKKALDLLQEHTRKPYWMISRMDVLDWARMMEKTVSKATVSQRLAGVNSFYEFVLHEFDDNRLVRLDGSRIKLFDENPGDLGKTARKQWKTNPYGKASYLSKTEIKSLLDAIDRGKAQEILLCFICT